MPDVFELPVSGIPAQLKIKGSSQTFEFDDLASVQTIMKNKFVPTLVANAQERLGWYNSNDCGFLFDHITTSTDTRGTFKLRSKVNDTYTDIFSVSNSNVLTFNASVGFDGLNLPKLGIGINPTVNGRIQFAATSMVNKLSLYNAGSDDYEQSGFGYNSLGTLYHAPAFKSHTFYLGDSTTIPLRVNSLGITIAELRPIDADFRRIMFYEAGENQHEVYNIGIKDLGSSNYAIHNQVASLNGGFTWGTALSASSSADLMTLLTNSTSKILNLSLQNPIAADVGLPAYTRFDLLNSTSGGARFLHTSASTDLVGIGTLKAQLVNSSGTTIDLWTGSVNSGTAIQDVAFPGTVTFNGDVTSANTRYFLMTGNSNAWQAFTFTNSHASANTFIRFNNAGGPQLNIGHNEATTHSYIDSIDPLQIKFNGTTSVYIDATTGNMGLGGMIAPHALLHFPNSTASSKIRLYEVGNNIHQVYGMGVDTSVYRFQIPTAASDSYVFYAGTSTTTSNELIRLTGTGLLGINNITPTYHCDVNGTTRAKRLLGNANAPTAVLAGATIVGTGASYSIVGTELGGVFTLNTGSSISASGTVATITLASAMPSGFSIVFGNAGTLVNATCSMVATSSSTFTITFNSNLAALSTYKFNYAIIGY